MSTRAMKSPRQESDAADERSTIPTSAYDFDQLADVYNQARVDYIVPMPMNGRRMKEYVLNYDIDLDASFISLNSDNLETGIGMLGIRDDRSWITRLGVLPHRRGYKIGQYLMDKMLEASVQRDIRLVQLEVIVGNDPAHNLFLKLGFEPVRELLIIRRAPGAPEARPEFDTLKPLPIHEADIPYVLSLRDPYASWVEETPSLLNAGSLRGFALTMPNGDEGWVVFQRSAFQIQHIVLAPDMQPDTAEALLYHLHREFPTQDTKTENVPTDHATWPIFQRLGYMESFRRTEMYLHLT